ncbi:MAG: DUF402 domain-containing protein [Thermoproteus sp.]
MYKARIRGIFSTALTKLALDWGFSVTQPTEVIAERFGLARDTSPPDVTVKDHESKTGIVVMGRCEAVEAFVSRLKELDPFVVKAKDGIKDVFVGTPYEEGGRHYVKTPGGGVAEIPNRYVVYPSARLFTILKPPIGPKLGVAVPEIFVVGSYLELDTVGGVKFSRHIGAEDRLRLGIFADSKLKPLVQGLGVRFKSSARFASEDALAAEAKSLYEELLRISSGRWGEGELVRRGDCLYLVLFDAEAKLKLDEVRASVVPTIRGHHALRAQGLGRCLDLLDHAGVNAYEKITEYLARGAGYVLHIKPWGDVVVMRGSPVGFKNGVLVIKRTLRPGGVLDGIGVKIERGFYALTCVKPGATYVVHSYYDASGRHVGTYVNINSPVEVGRRAVYIDLLVDKVYTQGAWRLIDLEEAERYREYFPNRFKRPEELAPPDGLICTEEGLNQGPVT